MSRSPLRNSVLLQRWSSHDREEVGGWGEGGGGLWEGKQGRKATNVTDLKAEPQSILSTVQQVSITPTTTSILPFLPRTPSLLLLLWRRAQKGCGRDM